MSAGFTPTPEKEKMQEWLWIPAIEKLASDVSPPLRVLCLPGRECRFLLTLLKKKLTTLSSVTSIERDATEALLIRGALVRYAGGGRPVIDIVNMSAYEFLAANERAVERRFHVIDLDPYGRLDAEATGLSNSVAAALDVQSRANVPDWLLLLQTEVASARNDAIIPSLAKAEETMTTAYADDVRRNSDPAMIGDAPVARLLRYGAGVAAFVASNAYPRFEVTLLERPYYYRGTSEYGVPSRRALMGAFAFRLRKPRRPLAALGELARRAKVEPIIDACVARCKHAKAVVAQDEKVKSGTLDLLSFA